MNNQKIKDILKDPNTNWKYIMIVAILALFMGSGILICVLSEQKLEIPIIKLPKKIVKEGETANWKTYKSSNMAFLVKYPMDWKVHEIPEDGGWYMSIHPLETSTVDFVVRQYQDTINCAERTSYKKEATKEIVFNNYPALTLTEFTSAACCGEVKSVRVCISDKRMEIFRSISFYNKERDMEYSSTLESMMSTLEFLE